MKKLSIKILSPVIFTALCLLFSACGNSSQAQTNQNTAPQQTPEPAKEMRSVGFDPKTICDVPKEAGADTIFGELESKSYAKKPDSNRFDCGDDGFYDELFRTDEFKVKGIYRAVGQAEKITYVTTAYWSVLYRKTAPAEHDYVIQFADYSDRVCESLYGVKLPDSFRKLILDAEPSDYKNPRDGSKMVKRKFSAKVGGGIALISSARTSDNIMLDIYFFPSEKEYDPEIIN